MPATTPGGLPYPLPSDKVQAGAADIRALAEAVEAKVGIVQRRPTSIANGGGTASVSGNKVTFGGVSSISLNGVFTSAFDEYLVDVRVTSFSAPGGGWIRLRAAGVDAAGSIYGQQQHWNSAATTLATAYSVTTGFVWAPVTFATGVKVTASLNAPASSGPELRFVSIDTVGQNSGALTNSSNRGSVGGGPYDGFSFIASTGFMTGYLRVFALI